MRRAGITLLLVLAATPAVFADTNVGGSITTNTTWTLAGSPYLATSTVYVFNNATLTIEPGVTVKFNANTGLTLGSSTAGILNAQGTATQSITFTSNSPTPQSGDWNGIDFALTTAASILDYCVIDYGGGGSTSANLRIASAVPTIQRSTIRNSSDKGILILNNGTNPTIQSSTIDSNVGNGIEIQAGSPTITANLITNGGGGGTIGMPTRARHAIQSDFGDGIQISGGSPTITDNTITNNSSNGITIVDGTPAITGGTIDGNGGGWHRRGWGDLHHHGNSDHQ